MTMNLLSVSSVHGHGRLHLRRARRRAVQRNGNAGATVLDDVRAKYNVDNDRTYLLGESAGTSAAEKLGFTIRQSYFAAYWANDVNAVAAMPKDNAAALGLRPGPGGAGRGAGDRTADRLVHAGRRLPPPQPGAVRRARREPARRSQPVHLAISWFPGKMRQ